MGVAGSHAAPGNLQCMVAGCNNGCPLLREAGNTGCAYTGSVRCEFTRLRHWAFLGAAILLSMFLFVFSTNAIAQAQEPIDVSGEEASSSEEAPLPDSTEPIPEPGLESSPSLASEDPSESYQEPVVSEVASEESPVPASKESPAPITVPEETAAAELEPAVETGGFSDPEPVVAPATQVPADKPYTPGGSVTEGTARPEPAVAPEPIVPPEPIVSPEPVVPSEPVVSPEPAVLAPAVSETETSESVTFEVTDSETFVPEPDVGEPLASEPAASEPAASEPAASEPAASEPAASEPAASEPAASEPAASEPPAEVVAAQSTVLEIQSPASEPVPSDDLLPVQETVHQDAAHPAHYIEPRDEAIPTVASPGPEPEDTEPASSAAYAPAVQKLPDKRVVEPASLSTLGPSAGPVTGSAVKKLSSSPPPRTGEQPAAYKLWSVDKMLGPWSGRSTVSFKEILRAADEPGRARIWVSEDGNEVSTSPANAPQVPPETPALPTPAAPVPSGGFLPAGGSSSGGTGSSSGGSEHLLDVLGVFALLSIFLVRGRVHVVPSRGAFVPGSLSLPVSERPG